jgi:dolichol-phosphate mannosyltransferase
VKTERALVIVPTYNERENVPTLIQRILCMAPDADVLLIDDNSPDGTADCAAQMFGADPRFSIMRRKGLRGLGRSYADGYSYALERGYTLMIQMDADFSHDPSSLPDLIKGSETADVVLGSRYCAGGKVRNWPRRRLWLSRFANYYVSLITHLKVHDATSGFRCFRKGALEIILDTPMLSEGYAFQVETLYRAYQAGLSIMEVPITFVDRRVGKSKISRKVIFESMVMPWRLRFNRR